MLIDIRLCEELFHTAAGTAFTDVLINGHRETWPIRSKRFRGLLRRRYYQATGEAASAAQIRSALDLLETRAQFDGPERAVHIRIAEHAGHTYLDLADEHWHAIDIGPDGWRVIGYPPVRFRRPAGMLPLPVPEQGGSIEALNSFLNLSSRNDFVLIVAWLLAALVRRPSCGASSKSRGPWVSRRSSHPCWGQKINTSRVDDADGADANVGFRFGLSGMEAFAGARAERATAGRRFFRERPG